MWSAPGVSRGRGQRLEDVDGHRAAIGVDAPVQPLTVDQSGVLPPPDTYDGTGWWRDGPEPGERGPAVIAGHVDSKRGPAVFFRLPDLGRGDQIFVDRADGTTAMFATQRIERHDKNAFPTDAVDFNTDHPRRRRNLGTEQSVREILETLDAAALRDVASQLRGMEGRGAKTASATVSAMAELPSSHLRAISSYALRAL